MPTAFLPVLLLLGAAAAAPPPRRGADLPRPPLSVSTDMSCDDLPGQWRGYSDWQPLAERYAFAWAGAQGSGPDASTPVNVTNLLPGPGEWTYATLWVAAGNASATIYFPEKDVWLAGPMTDGCRFVAWNNTSEWARDEEIGTVHLVFASHLDVGFTDLIVPSLNTYFGTYFPRALSLIAALPPNSSTPFRYLMHPWLVSLFFHCPENFTLANVTLVCPGAGEQAAVRAALENGTMYMTADPFNVEYEIVHTPEMGRAFFQLAKDLSAELGLPAPRVLSVRDVPGITRGVLPLLAEASIPYISEGVNSLTVGAEVPSPSIWYDTATNTSAVYVQHDGGYGGAAGAGRRGGGSKGSGSKGSGSKGSSRSSGSSRRVGDANCAYLPGFSEVLCLDWRGEGSGPPDNVAEVQQIYAAVQQEFPNATVLASTLEAYFDALVAKAWTRLPVFSSEIGDTWISGVAGDPQKTAFYRQAAEAYAACIQDGSCSHSDPRIAGFERFAFKCPEHTDGLHELSDTSNWGNEAFHALVDTSPEYVTQYASYMEQRNVTSVYAMGALGDHPLGDEIRARMASWAPQYPGLEGFASVPEGQWAAPVAVALPGGGTVDFALDAASGGLAALSVNGTTVVVGPGSGRRLGVLVYVEFNDTDFDAVQNCPVAYARTGDAVASPNSSRTEATLTEVWAPQGSTTAPYTLWLRVAFPPHLVANVGAPGDAWINVTVDTDGRVLHRVLLFNKTRTRLGEAIVFVYEPELPAVPGQWMLDKLATWVDPRDVAPYGGARQHSVSTGVAFFDPARGPESAALRLRTIDSPVVAPGTAEEEWTTLPFSVTAPTGVVDTWAVVVATNTWIMNYAVWSLDANMSFRFALEVGA
jgi:hypothetical protein